MKPPVELAHPDLLTARSEDVVQAPRSDLRPGCAFLGLQATAAYLDVVSRGRTTLFVTHRLLSVREADRIHVLDRGLAAEEGTHQELVDQDDLYARPSAARRRPTTP